MTSSKLKNPVEPNNASMLDSSFKVIIFTLLISNSTKYVLYPVGPINNIGSVSAHNKQLNKVFNKDGTEFKKAIFPSLILEL